MMPAGLWCWWQTHPRLRGPVAVFAGLQALTLAAVCTAPAAVASTNGHLLNWTGLTDSYGVPLGDYYLALASLPEQLTQTGPDVSLDPASWMAWSAHAMAVLAGRLAASTVLTAEAGMFVAMVALALWLMKLTLSTYWLSVIGEIARAISAAVIQVTTQLGLLLVAIPVGVFAGVLTIKRGEAGRGATMILIALCAPTLAVAVFADPAQQMYGPNGLLAFARGVGFSVGQAATHNGSVGAGQVDTLTASLITHTVREPLQLWNFGHVVDDVGGCGPAWSAAVQRGLPDGPIRAMQSCGDRAAVAYAQNLDGTNVWAGAVLVACAGMLASFMVAAGWAVLKVSVHAVWTTVILLPSLWLGAIPGAPQRRAAEVLWRFFRHGVEVLVYIVFVSVIGLAVERIVSAPLPAQLGGANPFAHVLMMAGVCVAGYVLLRHIRADLTGAAPARGMMRRGADVALGMGMTAALGATGSAVAAGGRGLLSRARSGAATPWEQLEAESARSAGQIHGPAQTGFDPVPQVGAAAGASHAMGQGAEGSGGALPDGPTPGSGGAGFAAMSTGSRDAGTGLQNPGPREPARSRRAPRSGGRDPSPNGAVSSSVPAPSGADLPGDPAEVDPIGAGLADWGPSRADDPGPPEPPADERREAPPPDGHTGPTPAPPTTVNPITNN